MKAAALDALKNAFEAQNPDIEIEFVQIPSSEYYTKVLTMIAGGTPPDVAMLGMDKLGTWVPRGALQDLRPYMEKYNVTLDAFFPAVVEAIEIDGGIYAFPRMQQRALLPTTRSSLTKQASLILSQAGPRMSSWRPPGL